MCVPTGNQAGWQDPFLGATKHTVPQTFGLLKFGWISAMSHVLSPPPAKLLNHSGAKRLPKGWPRRWHE